MLNLLVDSKYGSLYFTGRVHAIGCLFFKLSRLHNRDMQKDVFEKGLCSVWITPSMFWMNHQNCVSLTKTCCYFNNS